MVAYYWWWCHSIGEGVMVLIVDFGMALLMMVGIVDGERVSVMVLLHWL